MHYNINIKNYVFLVLEFGEGKQVKIERGGGGRRKNWNYIYPWIYYKSQIYLLINYIA